jgi:hypothetical protein
VDFGEVPLDRNRSTHRGVIDAEQLLFGLDERDPRTRAAGSGCSPVIGLLIVSLAHDLSGLSDLVCQLWGDSASVLA